ncbi:hypothetical protein THAOC_12553, partial [Thalassiosira oceanica]
QKNQKQQTRALQTLQYYTTTTTTTTTTNTNTNDGDNNGRTLCHRCCKYSLSDNLLLRSFSLYPIKTN